MTQADRDTYDVAVVGLGPVGMTMALLLCARGLRVLGLERRAAHHPLPRALGLDHESARTLQAIGVMVDLEAFTAPYRTSEYRAADGTLLRRIVAAPEPHPLGWPPNMTFIQPEMERLLLAQVAVSPNLTIRTGAEVTGFEVTGLEVPGLRVRSAAAREPGVSLRIASPGAQDVTTAQARYVVACDGAASPIRQLLGIKLEDLSFDEPWLVLDMLLTTDVALPEVNLQICDPGRPMTYVRGPGRLRRWEIMMRAGETPAEMLAETAIWGFLEPWLLPSQAEIWRAATYRFHALVAETWRGGRIFLAGDACHQTPPFLAQGLNQGIRDASNLAWKLASVLTGEAGPDLLDTYERERRPNVRAVISITKDLGRIICEQDPDEAALRNTRMAAEIDGGRGLFVRQDFVPPLADGLLDGGSDGAGKTCPQAWIEAPGGFGRMDDHLGSRWRIFLAPAFVWDSTVADHAEAAGITLVRLRDKTAPDTGQADRGTAIVEKDGVLAAWMTEHHCDCVLIRPDHVVFGTARGAAALARLVAGLPAPARPPAAVLTAAC